MKAKAVVHATIGLFGEPGSSKKSAKEWFVFIDCAVRCVGEGAEAFDLATKAVRSLEGMKNIPTGKSHRDQNMRAIMLEVAVEMTRAREFRSHLSSKERAKIDGAFDKIDAAFDKIDAAIIPRSTTTGRAKSIR